MAMTSTTSRPTTAVAALVVGGGVVVVGAILEWFSLSSGGESESVAGTDFSVGLGVLVFGVLAALSGLLLWLRSKRGARRGWAIAGIVFAVLMLIVSGWTAFAPESALAQFAAADVSEQLGVSESAAKAAIEAAIDQGLLSASAGIGAFVSLVGSVVALIGGILGARAIRKGRMTAPVPVGAPLPPPPA
jgi:hypothetical protein